MCSACDGYLYMLMYANNLSLLYGDAADVLIIIRLVLERFA